MTDRDAGSGDAIPAEERADLERDVALLRIGRLREEHGLQSGRAYVSARPCSRCGGTDARLIERGGQNTVRCSVCNVHIYNAPKTETGQSPRTVRALRRAIKPGQQARIFDRDLQRCVMCGTNGAPLTIGHLLSVEDGTRLGATTAELYSDANLAVMCETCNLGFSGRSISPRSYAAIMFRLVRAEQDRCAGRASETGADPPPTSATVAVRDGAGSLSVSDRW